MNTGVGLQLLPAFGPALQSRLGETSKLPALIRPPSLPHLEEFSLGALNEKLLWSFRDVPSRCQRQQLWFAPAPTEAHCPFCHRLQWGQVWTKGETSAEQALGLCRAARPEHPAIVHCQVFEHLPTLEQDIPEDLSPVMMEIFSVGRLALAMEMDICKCSATNLPRTGLKTLPGIVQGEGRGDAKLS